MPYTHHKIDVKTMVHNVLSADRKRRTAVAHSRRTEKL